MSGFLFFNTIVDDDVLVKPGRLPCIPIPNTGDRVQLKGGKPGLVQKTLDKEWATITAVTSKNFIVVEPDIKPGEIRIAVTDLYQYSRDGDKIAPTRNPLNLVEWKTLRGEAAWLKKERLYRVKLRQLLRNSNAARQLTHT